MKVYNKLVRDKIPEIIKNKGKIPVTRVADENEYEIRLIEKLKEEINEYEKSKNQEELVDILEIVDAIIKLKKIDKKELKGIKIKKSRERGGFDNKIILERVK